MADIQYKGESLELPENFTIPIEIYSSWFSDDINSSLSLPIKLPYAKSARNRKLLKALDLPVALLETERIDVLLEYGGSYIRAQMVFRNLDDELSVNLYFKNVELTALNDNLSEWNMPWSGTLANKYADGINNVWPDCKAYFRMMYNPWFYDDEETDNADKVNPNWDSIVNQYEPLQTNYTINFTANNEVFNVNSLVPQPALLEVLTHGFARDGFKLRGSFYENEGVRRAFLLSNKSLDLVQGLLAARNNRRSYNFESNGHNQIPLHMNVANTANYDLSLQEFTVPETATYDVRITLDIKHHSSSPVFYIFKNNVQLERIEMPTGTGTLFFEFRKNLAFTANDIVQVRLGNTIADSTTLALNSAIVRIQAEGVSIVNTFENPDNLQDFLPRITFSDLLAELKKAIGLRMRVNLETQTVYLDLKAKELTRRPGLDLTPYWTGNMPIEYFERKELLMHHESAGDDESKLTNDVYGRYVRVGINGQVTEAQAKPKPFDGEHKISQIYPPILRNTTVSGNTITMGAYYEKAVSDSYITDGELSERVRIGIATDWQNGYPVAGVAYEDFDLRYTTGQNSIARFLIAWQAVEHTDNRWYKPTFIMPTRLAQKLDVDKKVVLNSVEYLIEHLSYELGDAYDVEVEMKLKRYG